MRGRRIVGGGARAHDRPGPGPIGHGGDRGAGRHVAQCSLHEAAPGGVITQHPRARIVAITLGHDGRVHDLPAFKTLLVNAVTWAGSPR